MKVQFLKSSKLRKDDPSHALPEVGLVGRSNAGKSSFINALCLSKVAKVSKQPGKTRLLNFFRVQDSYVLVDMPGYGYAARARGEVESWRQMVESYLSERENLVGLILIMDIRRDWSEDEQMLVNWCQANDVPITLALNKSDKLSRNQAKSRFQKLRAASQLAAVFSVSATKKTGIKELEAHVHENWIRS